MGYTATHRTCLSTKYSELPPYLSHRKINQLVHFVEAENAQPCGYCFLNMFFHSIFTYLSVRHRIKLGRFDLYPDSGACQKRHLTDINSTKPIAVSFLLASRLSNHIKHSTCFPMCKSENSILQLRFHFVAQGFPIQISNHHASGAFEPPRPRADLRLPNRTFSLP